MDDFATRFFFETDGVRLSHWGNVAYQYYYTVAHSDWGFPVVSSIAVVAMLWMMLKTSQTVANGLGDLWVGTGLGKRFRAWTGRRAMRKQQRAKEDRWLADRFTDVVEEGVANGHITRASAQKRYGDIGKALGIADLIPKVPPKKRQLALKDRLKRKYKGKVVELAEIRKEMAKSKKLTLKERLALASSKAG